jgi:hypothetical protein
VLNGTSNTQLATLVALFDAMGYDLVLNIRERA